MLNKLCERAYLELKQTISDYPTLLGEDQAFVCAEFRPDWTLLDVDFDNEDHLELIRALDNFFIETCLRLAQAE